MSADAGTIRAMEDVGLSTRISAAADTTPSTMPAPAPAISQRCQRAHQLGAMAGVTGWAGAASPANCNGAASGAPVGSRGTGSDAPGESGREYGGVGWLSSIIAGMPQQHQLRRSGQLVNCAWSLPARCRNATA